MKTAALLAATAAALAGLASPVSAGDCEGEQTSSWFCLRAVLKQGNVWVLCAACVCSSLWTTMTMDKKNWTGAEVEAARLGSG